MEGAIDGFVIMAIYLLPLLAALSICGLLADYVLPRCPRLLRLIERILQVDFDGEEEWNQ